MNYRIEENTAAVEIEGELDHHSLRGISLELQRIIDTCLPKTLVLDLRNVRFMDSSGIALVIGCTRKMSELNGRVILRNVPAQPMKVFDAAGVTRLVAVETTGRLVQG